MNVTTERTADTGELDESTAEIERAALRRERPTEARHCENCGAALAGPYCSQCGQRHHEHPVHSLWHFIQEATEDVTHADSRLWRTVYALLLRPGFLTQEFLAGRRARYLPPVRLYLVVSVLFFLITGLQSSLSPPAIQVSDSGGSFHYEVVPGRAGAAATEVAPATLPMRSVCAKVGVSSPTLGVWCAALAPRIQRSWTALNAAGGVERLQTVWERNFERAMFVFLPLVALLMIPLYRNPRRYYVEHLLFLVHNQVCLFAVLGLYALLGMVTSSNLILEPISIALSIYVPVYFYLAMRRVYGQSPWRTFGKLAALSVDYFGIGLLMLVVIVTYSFLAL